jgi:hypothetical protein
VKAHAVFCSIEAKTFSACISAVFIVKGYVHFCTDSLNSPIFFELMGCSVELMVSSVAVFLRVPEPSQKKQSATHSGIKQTKNL